MKPVTESVHARLLKTASFAIVLAAAGGAGQSAQAQSSTQSAASGLPDVVVTAERRSQRLQDVPIAATVLNAEQLEDRGVKNVADLQQVSPSIAINTYNRSTFVNIRGIGIAQSAPTSSPGVAYYMNGALVPHEQSIGGSFYDISSVEVLRGPQGTLTGQNSTGGAIYLRTTAPVLDKWSGVVDQTIGEYDWRRTVLAANVPVGGMIAARIAGVYDRRDSFTQNLGSSPSQPGNGAFEGARADILFQPADVFSVNLRHEYFYNHPDYNAIKNRRDSNANPFQIYEDAVSYNHQKGNRTDLEVNWSALPEAKLRWLSSYQIGSYQDVADGDRTSSVPSTASIPGSSAARVALARTGIRTEIHEADLISTGEGKLDWVLGAFKMREVIPLTQYRFACTGAPCDDFVGAGAIAGLTRAEAHNTSVSGFGQASYDFTQKVEGTLGLRYSEDKQVYYQLVVPGGSGTGVQRSNATTGRVGLNFKPSESVLLYGTVSRGYKAGGVNLAVNTGNFQPETNVVSELGFKSTIMDGQLRLNGDVFFSDYNDIQLSALVAGSPRTQNAPGAKSSGAEAELLAAFGDMHLNAGAAYLNAEFSQAVALQNTVTSASETVPVGRRLPFSPRWTFNGGVEYDFNLGEQGVLTPRVQASYLSEQWATPFPSAATYVGDRTVWDAKLIYTPNNAPLRAEFFITNLTDEVYVASQVQNSSSFDGGILYGAPRQIGARLSYKFN